MTSKPSLFVRILLAVTHKIWAVIFFLVSLSLATIINHYWAFLVRCCQQVQAWSLLATNYFHL